MSGLDGCVNSRIRFGSTEVESRAMLLIDLLDKKVLTLSDLNLKSLNRI